MASNGRRKLTDQFSGKGKNARSGKVHVYSEEEIAEFQAKIDAEKATESNDPNVTLEAKPIVS